MFDWQSHRPYGAQDQDGASRMFRNKPANPGLNAALTQGGTNPTQNAYEQGGITGGNPGVVQAPPMQAPAPAPSAPPINGTHPFDYKVMGHLSGAYNTDKLQDPNHNTAKYQMGRTLDQFDARQGFTPESIAALNALGLGNFSGSGQKLSMHGATDAGRAAGLGGDYDNADFIENFSGGNGKWQYADPYAEAQSPQHPALTQALGNAQGMLSAPGQLNPNISTEESSRSYLDQLMKELSQNPALLRALQGGQ